MDRRTFLCGLTLGTLAAPLAAEAQEHGKVFRVGRLSVSAVGSASTEALRRGLREFGWAVDQNLLIEMRSAEGDAKRLPALAADLVRTNVDVIVEVGSDSVDAAFRATKSVPIVMAVGSDPERRGWIKSLARPGGNVTGLIAFLPEMAGKRIEFVKELLPKARRVGVMTDTSPGNRPEFEHVEAAGRALSLEIQYVQVKIAEDLDAALTQLRNGPVDALYVQSSARVLDPLRGRIAAFVISARLPVIGTIPFHAESGFLLSGDPNLLGQHFAAPSWGRWKAAAAALFALPFDAAGFEAYQQATQREKWPKRAFKEAYVVVGRRGGKSQFSATVAVYLACFGA